MTAAPRSSACPACLGSDTSVRREHAVSEAAEHFIPLGRDRDRNAKLRAALEQLFGADRVEVRECADCGFWFADPFVAGTPETYNLVTQGQELYPQDRFEFGLTLDSLPRRSDLNLLEMGAGDGAFMRQLRDSGRAGRLWATEYDDGSLASLAAIPGVTAQRRSPAELAAESPDPFDTVCMFQVLEHMDRLDDVFSALNRLVVPGGQAFISVPHSAGVTWQEEHTGYWDMPPNHVGRWTRPAMDAVAARHGFSVVDHRLEAAAPAAALWEMARYRTQARAYDARSLSGRVNAIPRRSLRGPAKRLLAGWDLLALAPHYGRVPPHSQWFRLTRTG